MQWGVAVALDFAIHPTGRLVAAPVAEYDPDDPFAGLLGATAPPGTVASGVVLMAPPWLADTPFAVTPSLPTDALLVVVGADATVFSGDAQEGSPLVARRLGDMHESSAALRYAVVLSRRLGVTVAPPEHRCLGACLANSWAKRCLWRSRRLGRHLDPTEVAALDPIDLAGDPAAPYDDWPGVFERMASGDLPYRQGVPGGASVSIDALCASGWLDPGALGWMVFSSTFTTGELDLFTKALASMQIEALAAFRATIVERGWLPSRWFADAVYHKRAQRLQLGDLDRRLRLIIEAVSTTEGISTLAVEASTPLDPDEKARQELYRSGTFAAIAELFYRYGPVRRDVAFGTAVLASNGLLGAFAYRRLGRPRTRPPFYEALDPPPPPEGVEAVEELCARELDRSLPFGGLYDWDVPEEADGIVLTAATQEAMSDPSWRGHGPSDSGMLALGVARDGVVACGRLHRSDDLFGHEPDELVHFVSYVPLDDLTSLTPEPLALILAVAALALVGRSAPPPRPDPLGPYLASVWAKAIEERSAQTGGLRLSTPDTAACDPLADPSWHRIAGAPDVFIAHELVRSGLASLPDADPVTRACFGPLDWLSLGPSVFAWALEALRLPSDAVLAIVARSCDEGAAAQVVSELTTRRWLLDPVSDRKRFAF